MQKCELGDNMLAKDAKYPKVQTGDRILSRRKTDYLRYFSSAIAWWLHSNWSHVVPVINAEECLDILWPKPKIVNPSMFLSDDYRIAILRPKFQLSDDQILLWHSTAEGLLNQKYDLESFAGFILDDPKIQNPRKVNCSEGTLICDKSIGLLAEYDGRLVSPQTYEDFAIAGLFNIIYMD